MIKAFAQLHNVQTRKRLLLVRCHVLHEMHEIKHQWNKHLTRVQRVSLLTCSWSVLLYVVQALSKAGYSYMYMYVADTN